MADVAKGLTPLRVTVVVCVGPREAREQVLELPAGATVGDALDTLIAQGATTAGQGDVQLPSVAVGVWGRPVGLAVLLAPSDRLEIYRPLTVDPKVARRERFVRQGARTTGLFARTRPGGKAGY